jgi:NAD(P)-dependent dehydrogenase (short-subunit alcohol dehydrogenase family)
MKRWTTADIPDLSGRTAVVTGANAGLGLQTARVLAERGAEVVLACRDLDKAKRAADRIRAGDRRARVTTVRLDLASLASVREAADEIRSVCQRLALLINNAGVMEVPYERTEDGFELTFATNHLGHFALTGLVLDRLLATPGSRIVTLSSLGHLDGAMSFDDLQSEGGYRPDEAYGQSKLANLLFTYELDRRLRGAGAPTIALASHPGVVYTNLFRTRSRLEQALISPRMRVINFWAVQSVQMGALPTLRAAADPSARGGEYYGPRRRFYTRFTGYPGLAESSERSHDAADQARLWEVSERLTGVTYHITAGPPYAEALCRQLARGTATTMVTSAPRSSRRP